MKSNRRSFIGNSAMGLFGILPFTSQLNFGEDSRRKNRDTKSSQNDVLPSYPTTDPALFQQVVGASHTRFEVVKELVSARPELAKATHDWGFGDVESALGAASHMGRKDIADFLIDHGARPNVFTYAMLGKLESVKAMVTDMPGVQRIKGPHGITLLAHAQMRLRRENVEGAEKEEQEALVEYLIGLGDADLKDPSLDITEEEQKVYLGKYDFGTGEDEYFQVSVNNRGMLSLARGDYSGRVLNRRDTHQFAPGGAPSVRVHFDVVQGQASTLTIHDPTPIVKALRAD